MELDPYLSVLPLLPFATGLNSFEKQKRIPYKWQPNCGNLNLSEFICFDVAMTAFSIDV